MNKVLHWVFLFLILVLPISIHAQSLEFGPPYLISGGFENPFGVAIGGTPGTLHLFVADTRNRQIRWAPLNSLAGTPSFQTFGYVTDVTQPAALLDPQGIAADGNGHVYVVDARRNQVNLYTWDATTGNYVYDPAFASSTRNSVVGVAIESPRDVTVTDQGGILLLDSGRKRILRADGPADTSWEVFLSDPTLGNAYGLAFGPDKRLYVADTDNHRIVRYEADGTKTTFGQLGTGAGEFRFPRDVTVDIDGRIYVVDSNNHRIAILDQNGRHLLSLGRAPSIGLIQKIAIDKDRHVYLTDSDHNRVIAYLGGDVPIPFDGWVRDYIGDSGSQPSDPSFVLGSPDILVRHNPDVNLAAVQANGLETIPFENPRYGEDNYVYIAVRNRGTQAFQDGMAFVYWVDPTGSMSFPADWKSTGFFTGPSAVSAGNRIEIPSLAPGAASILGPFTFRPPQPEISGSGNGRFVLGVRIVHPFDVAISSGGMQAVRDSNNVALRTVHVVRGPFPTGDQNTLILRVRYSDDPTPVNESTTTARIDDLTAWTNEVSWGKASVKPLYRGDVTLPHTRAYYADPSRSPLVEMATDGLNIVLAAEPDLVDGVSASPLDDITRVILVTNDMSQSIHFATTGPWPYRTSTGDRYLTVSIQGITSSSADFEHGFGHQMSMLDLFAYPNVSFPRPFAEGWDAMAIPFTGVHPTVWSKQLATWVTELGANIVFVPRPANGQRYAALVPLYTQTNAALGRNVGIAVGLTPGVRNFTDETAFYYLEARQKTGADTALPSAGVLMYYVNTNIPQGQGPIIVRDHGTSTPGLGDAALQIGDTESPAGTGLRATVRTGTAGGSDYVLDLEYDPPLTGYDVSIRRGDPVWTSQDIWIDNQSDGYDLESGRSLTDRGDAAIGEEENRIYARVHNAGPADAFDVEVAFFISEPYHTVGGEEDFTFLKSIVIPQLPPGDTMVYVPWTPSVRDPHTCVKVVLRRLIDDTNRANNDAQQNLEVKWSTTHSPYTPVDFSFQITNPDPNNKLIYFRADRVPAGWTKQLSPEKAYVQPNGKLVGMLRVVPPPDAFPCSKEDIFVTAWTPIQDTLVQIGGATVQVNLAKQATIKSEVVVVPCDSEDIRRLSASYKKDNDSSRASSYKSASPTKHQPRSCVRIVTKGCTDPAQPNTEVIIRYQGPNGVPVYHKVKTDSNGCYEDFFVTADGGKWEVDAQVSAHSCLAPATAQTPILVPVGESGPLDNPSIVDAVHFTVEGKLQLLSAGSKQCKECVRRETVHSIALELLPSKRGGPAAHLSAEHLTSVFDVSASHGVHSGKAQLDFQDGTIADGEMHGISNASSHPRLADAKKASWRVEGQFNGLIVKGKKLGCWLILSYSIELDADPSGSGAIAKGRTEGTQVCSGSKGIATVTPEPLSLPDGCAKSFTASAKGTMRLDVEKQKEAAGREVLIEAGTIETKLVPSHNMHSVVDLQSDLDVSNFRQVHSDKIDSPAFHSGDFNVVASSGAHIIGKMIGNTNIDVHHDGRQHSLHHVEGVLSGNVDIGRLSGCQLYAIYSADYSNDKIAKINLQIEGTIICGCEKVVSSDPRPIKRVLEGRAQDLSTQNAATSELSDEFAFPPGPMRGGKSFPGGSLATHPGEEQFRSWDENKDKRLSRDEVVPGSSKLTIELLLQLDRDRNGVLEGEELSSIPIAAQRIADENHDGKLSYEELKGWAVRGANKQFKELDRDSNGLLSLEEYLHGAQPVIPQSSEPMNK